MHKNTKSVANAVLSVVLLVSVMSMSFSGTGLAFAQDGATSTPTAVEPTATLGVTAEPAGRFYRSSWDRPIGDARANPNANSGCARTFATPGTHC